MEKWFCRIHSPSNYLNFHDSPEDIEVYYCGPPLMNLAVEKMALDFEYPRKY